MPKQTKYSPYLALYKFSQFCKNKNGLNFRSHLVFPLYDFEWLKIAFEEAFNEQSAVTS